MRRAAAASAIVLAVGACAPAKPPSVFETDFDDDTKAWREIEAQLPAPPQDADLMPFSVGSDSSYYYRIDRKALSIGSDGVFRYTLVATSAQGARNVSYEGIRCEKSERKIYAIGRDDGRWVRARNAAWVPVEDVARNRYHAALMKEYFCPNGSQQTMRDVLGRFDRRLPSTIL